MKIWHIAIPLVIIGVAFYAVPRMGKSTTIEQDGNQLSIAIGDHRLTATVVGNQITDSFLVIGGGVSCAGLSCGDLHFTSLLSMIPMGTAERLYQRYGNFRQCSSPGAREGMRSVISLLLYTDNAGVERKLKKAEKLAKAVKDPVIKMTFVQIEITDHKIECNGETIQVNSLDDTEACIVKDIEIIEESHKL